MATKQQKQVKKQGTNGKRKSEIRSWVRSLTVGILGVLIFRGMVAQAYQIPSGSMEKTLLVGDYIYINKMLYGPEIDLGMGDMHLLHHRFPGFRKPHPGDIIVFRYPVDLRKDFIKRCVAVEGQTVAIRDKILYVDGKKQDEPYVIHEDNRIIPFGLSPRDNFGPITIPKGKIFMMGDNRDNSLDSRFWGPLPVELVKGKAIFRYFSWDGERNWPRFGQILRPLT
ncbi:MAG: signal peptidase I [Candidatus Eisenbacteria bacterium]|uniref:Signal peptidase I n=1 Tax=Eiseniibacteriota bacterium TaxID=2212470 RepID=A0A538T3L9_UNCEI|nr:MAG: signal peptidase I [Candidatus Eisenbacteria bacterium]TMQ58229.1 MAG: signal peptidase I [Candidatus Eisenbacteria bacterium]